LTSTARQRWARNPRTGRLTGFCYCTYYS